MKTIENFSVLSLALAICSLSFLACEKNDPLYGEFQGKKASFGSGTAYTYILNDDEGNPVEVGVAIDKTAFDNFTSTSGDFDVSIDYPAEASKTPFVHQYLTFAAHGHDPMGIYDVPHFDLHFYTIPEAIRAAISPFDTVKAAIVPGAEHFPAAYFPTPLVPTMGVHWLDGTAPEFNGGGFTQTFIWGSFDGKVTFLEPMITKAFIQEKHNYETDIRQPAKYDQPGKYYPTRQGFKHNDDTGEHRFYLRGFIKR